ncbi:MAG: hypothetical protein KIT84_42105, partial [Labilithrix sp.]|nr:hypothetical protein [Labilithrix sp.]
MSSTTSLGLLTALRASTSKGRTQEATPDKSAFEDTLSSLVEKDEKEDFVKRWHERMAAALQLPPTQVPSANGSHVDAATSGHGERDLGGRSAGGRGAGGFGAGAGGRGEGGFGASDWVGAGAHSAGGFGAG